MFLSLANLQDISRAQNCVCHQLASSIDFGTQAGETSSLDGAKQPQFSPEHLRLLVSLCTVPDKHTLQYVTWLIQSKSHVTT